ncbi:MAG: hypothetical protein SH850_23410, partial [Planctomycetaceae bacterium]|nr:hypothetical protein [Planctomycetaceae bacterium]
MQNESRESRIPHATSDKQDGADQYHEWLHPRSVVLDFSPGGAADRSPRRNNISDLCRKSMKLDDPDGVDEQLDPH